VKPLAVSLGDPAGVGPELIGEAWARREAGRLPPFFVCGGAQVLREAAKARGLMMPVERIASPAEAEAAFERALPVLGDGDGPYRPGEPDADGARLALASLEHATALARGGDAAGLVTGPIAKALLAAVGFAFPGQTEFVADACGVAAEDAVMMLAGRSLKTVPLTVHVALAEVPALLSTELIVRRGRIVAAAMRRDFGIARPRVAVCGLNPHAGESGRMGREEIEIVAPAIAALPLDSSLFRTELFAPLLAIGEISSFDEAIAESNRTEYGLTAGIYSGSDEEVARFFDEIQAGVCYANKRTGATTGAWPGAQAFTGWKGSGSSGKGGCGPYYVMQFMREQSRTTIHAPVSE